ncbi:MAG: hypothetical protein ACK4TO_08035 [Candidatus Nitrosotenuis sp.]
MLTQKRIPIIAGIAAAAIIAAVLVTYQGMPESESPVKADETQAIPEAPLTTQTYKINTECELIYGFAFGVYPDNQKIPPIVLAELTKKYPGFEPWKSILDNNETRKAFLSEPLPQEFSDILVTSIMTESSINPKLKDIAMHLTDPQGVQKLQGEYEKYGCQAYFDSRK